MIPVRWKRAEQLRWKRAVQLRCGLCDQKLAPDAATRTVDGEKCHRACADAYQLDESLPDNEATA